MAFKKENDAIKFIQTTLRSVEVLGQEKTITLLNEAITNYNSDVVEVVDLMFKCIYKTFLVDKGEILFGKSRKGGRRVEAIICATYILTEHTQASNASIYKFLNKDKATISRCLSEYNALSDKVLSDRQLKEKIKEVESEFLSKYKSIKESENGEKKSRGK